MNTRNGRLSKRFSKIFFERGGAAAAVSLLACLVLSSSANALTFTLAELDAGDSFTIGNLEFFDWDIGMTTVDTNIVTLTTVDTDTLPGFMINGNGEFEIEDVQMGDDPRMIDYSYSVRTVDQRAVIGGALLWATNYSIENGAKLDITLADQAGFVDLDVTIFEPFGSPITNLDLPADSVNLLPRLSSLTLTGEVVLDLPGLLGSAGPGVLNSYVTLFTVVPESSTGLLLGLGLVGLGVAGRPRRAKSQGTG